MDVTKYRKIVLGLYQSQTAEQVRPLLGQKSSNYVPSPGSFLMNNNTVCYGWWVGERLYPVFQRTRHVTKLQRLKQGLRESVQRRQAQRITRRLLRHIQVLVPDALECILQFC